MNLIALEQKTNKVSLFSDKKLTIHISPQNKKPKNMDLLLPKNFFSIMNQPRIFEGISTNTDTIISKNCLSLLSS